MARRARILTAAVVLLLAAPVSAQDLDSGTLSPIEYQAELDDINSQATTSKVLYVLSPHLIIGGALGGLIVLGIASVVDGDDGDAAALWGITAACFAVFAGGVAMLIGAIWLDIDSGDRRRALRLRRPSVELTSLGVAPTEGGAALQLGGRFL